jgi:HlyD family secretion protein
MIKKIVIIALIVAAAAGFFVWNRSRAADAEGDKKYQTAVVERGTVTATVTATGTVSAVTTVQIGSQVSGVIARLHADFNSPVKEGQLIAELDPTPFEAQVEQRRADVEKAAIDLRNADINLKRQQRLAAEGLAPQAELDTALAVFDTAGAQVEQARAALNQAETNLSYTKIRSPIDGVVADRQYDVGQTVAASFQAPTLFTIAQDLTKMQIQADVDQADIGRVEIGQHTMFTVDAYPEERFDGEIRQIRLNATVTQNVVTYPVIIEVANPEEKLRPNMTANVTIDVAKVEGVLRIPNAALRFKPDTKAAETPAAGAPPAQAAQNAPRGEGQQAPQGSTDRQAAVLGGQGSTGVERTGDMLGQARRAAPPRRNTQTVYRLEGTELKPVEIRTGITDGRFTQVVEGELKEGDVIVTGTATSRASTTGSPMSSPMGGARGRP